MMPNTDNKLNKHRVTLRPPLPEDSSLYFRWINDKELVLHNADFKPVTRQHHDQWFNQLNTLPESCFFSIVETDSNQLIGSCSLRHLTTIDGELQIRIGDSAFHGKGYGSEAIRLLIDHGFTTLHLQRIFLHVFCRNLRAIKAYEKCGFGIDCKLENAAWVNQEWIDMYRMSIHNSLLMTS